MDKPPIKSKKKPQDPVPLLEPPQSLQHDAKKKKKSQSEVSSEPASEDPATLSCSIAMRCFRSVAGSNDRA